MLSFYSMKQMPYLASVLKFKMLETVTLILKLVIYCKKWKNTKNHSSEKERKNPKEHSKTSKNETIKIDREEILVYPQEQLPADAQFKGYEEVVVQDILLKPDNILFRKQKYYSPRTGKTYLAPLPTGYEGEFGPGIKALAMSLYYGGNITQEKLLEFLEDIGISISAGTISNLLIKNQENFEVEYEEVYKEGLASSPCLEKFAQRGEPPHRNFSLATL